MPDSAHTLKNMPAPTLFVTGEQGIDSVLHMLKAVVRMGGLPVKTKIEKAKPCDTRSGLLVDADKSIGPSVCRLEQVKYHHGCSCFAVTIKDTRLMVKVMLPGKQAVKNALIILVAVDSLGGDLALAALALANIKPLEGLSTTVTRITNENTIFGAKPNVVAAE